jgi:hypothetical protein
MMTIHTTWSSFISRVILAALLISGLVVVLQGHSPYYAANAAAVPRCVDIQLAVGATAAQGGSLHAGMVLHYRNSSSTACSLIGYPDIVGLNLATGKSHAAGHLSDGYLGGWEGYVNGRAKPLPLVVLRARKGVASSMVEWADCGTAQQKGCTVLTSLWVDAPGGTRPFAFKERILVSGYFDATPIVPSDTGSAN